VFPAHTQLGREVAEIGERAELLAVDSLHQGDEGVRVARRSAVVLADNTDVVRGAVFGQRGAGLGGSLDIIGSVVTLRVDADGVASQGRGGIDPLLMIL